MKPDPRVRPSLEGERFQVIVIGGGINGVAIARECARAQRRTLLLEQSDFGAGTTSRSTRLIHGGLRYLEHGEIGQVRESLRERARLLRERPHLVRPIDFLLALDENSRRSALKVRLGLWMYRSLLGKNRRPAAAQTELHRFEDFLDSGRKWSVFDFEDAQCEFPERLVAEWLVEATDAGAVARNHTQVLVVDVAYGRAKGVLARDMLTGVDARLEAGWIINSTGPWADRLCQRSAMNTGGQMIGGVRGSHIVLPRFPGAPDVAVFTEAADGRPIFVIPWNGQTLVGTTEVPDTSDPSKIAPAQEEMEYLLGSVQNLFPRAGISGADIRYVFAGVRPLPFTRKQKPSAITRRHFLHDHSKEGIQRMISVIGGKLTTAAQVARECARAIGIQVEEPYGVMPVPETGVDDYVAEVMTLPGISEAAAETIAEWHGKRALNVLQLARASADMRATLCPHTEHIVAEAIDAFEHEHAATLSDALLRRVPVAFAGCWSEECSRVAAGRIGAAMSWNEARIRMECEEFEREQAAFLRRPAPAEHL